MRQLFFIRIYRDNDLFKPFPFMLIEYYLSQ